MKKYITKILIIFGVFAVLSSAFLYVVRDIPKSIVATEVVVAKSIFSTYPSVLFIPKLGINSNVEEVGLTKEGDMGVPENSSEVGWYKFGTVPGKNGNAVIAGHLDNFKGEPLVFARLSELVTGDSIYVMDKEGKSLHFKVTKKVRYTYDEEDTKDIFGPSDSARLNLITCEGDWLTDERKNYSERLVVFSELVV